MSNKVANFISYDDLLVYFGNAEEIIKQMPQEWQATQWLSILNGTSSLAQLNTTENSLSPQQIKLYEELNSIISKVNLSTVSNIDKAIALVYRAAVAMNRLLPKDLAETLADSIKFKSEYLDLSNQEVNDQQAFAIAAILPCTNISTLNLMNNNVNGDGAIALIKLNLLSTLNLNNNQIKNDQIAIECGNCSTLSELYLDGSQFTLNGHMALNANKKIKKLSLNKCQINSSVAECYAMSDTFLELHLDENNLDEEIIKKLANNQIFLKLSLRRNNLTDASAAKFEQNTTLRWLDLSGNLITSTGAKAFANTKIETLILSNNKIDDSTPAALSSNPTLESVDLSYNNLNTEALKVLYDVNPLSSYNAATKAGAKPEFPSLRRLSTFAVKNVPNIPDAVLEKLPAEITAYLKQHKV